MIEMAFLQLRSRWQRSIAVFIAVLIGVAFFTIALLAGGLYNNAMEHAMSDQVAGADLIVRSENDDISAATADRISGMGDVAFSESRSSTAAQLNQTGTFSVVYVSNVPNVPDVRDSIELKSGAWPEANDEIAISSSMLDQTGLDVGDTIAITSWQNDTEYTFTIVGETPSPSGLAVGVIDAFVTPELYAAFNPDPFPFAILIQLEDGADLASAQSGIADQLGGDYEVATIGEYSQKAAEAYSGGTAAINVLLGAFAAIAMIAAGIVISNSFEINVAQRVREIGLLRSVGSTIKQVRRMILVESLVIGVLAAAAGVLLGIGLVSLASQLIWGGDASARVTIVSVAVPFVIGLIATMIAALAPARSAMRVHPLQAIRQSDAPVVTAAGTRRRKLLAIGLFVIGAAILGGAAVMALNGGAESGLPLLVGMVGGALTFFAVLASSQLLLPAVARLLGRLSGKLFGVTGELALGNLDRNPRRTASASSALLMGITLITMMSVGAASVESTIVGVVSDEQPIDLVLESSDISKLLPDAEITRWQITDGVDALAEISSIYLQLDNGNELLIDIADPGAVQSVLRSDFPLPAGEIALPAEFAEANAYGDGDTMTLTGDLGTVDLTVRVSRVGIDRPMIATETASQITSVPGSTGAWLKLDDDVSVGSVMDPIRDGLPASLDLYVAGGAADREEILDILDTMLLVAVGLLAASVVIAMVGIGNTLTLSMIERTRESGMLRAMGLKRGQVRRMLAIEGAVLALVGGIVGLLLGIAYGFAGTVTLFGNAMNVSLAVPWSQILLIGGVALVCGVIASFLPAQHALKVKPIEALADL